MLSHEMKTPGAFRKGRRYIAINTDGTTAAVLPDLIAIATYLVTYNRDVEVIAEHGSGHAVWHGTKERQRERLTTDQIINQLKTRVVVLKRAGAFDDERQRWNPHSGKCQLDRFPRPTNPPKTWKP